jgi:aldehyde dehydrogenase (NAD+)
LVERSAYEAVIARLTQAFEQLRVGPAEMDLDCGPLIRHTQLQRVTGFLDEAKRDGLTIAAQGHVVKEAPQGGFYQVPTLIRDVPPKHRLAQEEVFGPVIAIMPFDDEAHAVALANGTWRARCARAKCSSTTTARAVALSCRLGASKPAVTDAKKASKRCTASPF